MRWIAMFSQTGSELVNLCTLINKKPDLILYNGKEQLSQKIKDLHVEIVQLAQKPSVEDYLSYFSEDNVITLHGWLRVIPKVVCEKYEGKIFNGHPGLITEDETLKGFNPQIKAFEKKSKRLGSVLHEVTAGVDEGKILYTSISEAPYSTLEDVYEILKQTSINTWIEFSKDFL